jgi:hypothetical protein
MVTLWPLLAKAPAPMMVSSNSRPEAVVVILIVLFVN